MAEMVKGLGRLLASQSHPCRNLRSARVGLWGFRIWRGRVRGANPGTCRSAPAGWTSSGRRLSLSGDGIDEFGVHEEGHYRAWREPFRRPAMRRSRLNERIMPGHVRFPGLVVERAEVSSPVSVTPLLQPNKTVQLRSATRVCFMLP